jgi:hypothetical protein
VERQRAAVVAGMLARGTPGRLAHGRDMAEAMERHGAGRGLALVLSRHQASSVRWSAASAARAGKQGREGEERERKSQPSLIAIFLKLFELCSKKF